MGMASHSRETWLDAAFHNFNQYGLAAVRVEALARELGATKGSFYWHFENRAALVAAIMDRWEQSETDRIIELTRSLDSAEQRLATVYDLVGMRMMERGGEKTLYAEAESEGVADVVARVTARRIAYVAEILAELGVSDAEERATVAVSAAIGLQQLYAGGWRSEHVRGISATLFGMSLSRPA